MVKFDNNNKNYKLYSESIQKKWTGLLKNGDILSVLFTGVGGQGIILATTVVAHAAINAGFDVKVSEVHGMAQRGGSVEGSVRIGKEVFSPTVVAADFIVSLEKLEGLRYACRLKKDGIMIINDYEIYPSTVFSKKTVYPSNIGERLNGLECNYLFINAAEKAIELNEIRLSNTILTGVLSRFLPIDYQFWTKAISENIPGKILDINLEAFDFGRNLF